MTERSDNRPTPEEIEKMIDRRVMEMSSSSVASKPAAERERVTLWQRIIRVFKSRRN